MEQEINTIPSNKLGLQGKNDSYMPCPALMTEKELIKFLRIPEITKAQNHHNVIENLKRMHDLPCIHICKKPLYPLNAVRNWVDEKLLKEKKL
jgi:hypothetical protein